MRQAYVTASGIPYSNKALLQSAYAGLEQIYLTCDMRCISKIEFPSIWNITVSSTSPVVVQQAELHHQIKDDAKAPVMDNLLTLTDHREMYNSYRQKQKRSLHGLPFTLRTGGFLYVEREGDEGYNDPCQFVLKRTGNVQSGFWAPPGGLASEDLFTAMCRNITRESGLILLDERNHVATVVVPDFKVEGPGYASLAHAAHKFDGVATKQAQVAKIRSALEFEGFGDYRIEFKKFDAVLLKDKLPPRDIVNFTSPQSNGSQEIMFRAFVAKDRDLGSANIHLPFKLVLPNDQRLITIDCSGTGREAALKTQDELRALECKTGPDGKKSPPLVPALRDLIERPFKTSYYVEYSDVIEAASRKAAKNTALKNYELG